MFLNHFFGKLIRINLNSTILTKTCFFRSNKTTSPNFCGELARSRGPFCGSQWQELCSSLDFLSLEHSKSTPKCPAEIHCKQFIWSLERELNRFLSELSSSESGLSISVFYIEEIPAKLLTGSTISTLLHDRINPKDCQVASPLVIQGFNPIF